MAVAMDVMEDAGPMLGGSLPSSPTPKTSPRLYFPETWLWGSKMAE